MAGAVAVAVRRSRQEIVRHLTEAGAVDPDHAVPFDPDTVGWRHARIRRRVFRQMQAAGAVREVQPGRFYLDQEGLEAYRATSRRRAFGLVAVIGAAVAAVIALG